MEENNNTISPAEYFRVLKDSKHVLTDSQIKESYQVILKLYEKYQKTGQSRSLQRLKFLTETLEEEEKLIPLGVTTYVYRDVVEDYIDNVAQDVVKVIELRNYIREIPDEIVEVIDKTKDIFSEFYIVFTDYTGREERRVAKERREKDPILFGCFKKGSIVSDRFYFLGDWTDEFCDLTLDKMIEEYKAAKDVLPTHPLDIPKTLEEVIEIVGRYQPKEGDDTLFLNTSISSSQISKPKKSFFGKIRSIFKK